jgi:hypothetical protein
MGGHSGDKHRHGDLDSGSYPRRPNKPDKEEVIGQAGEKDVLFLKQLIEAGKYREVIDRSSALPSEHIGGDFRRSA